LAREYTALAARYCAGLPSGDGHPTAAEVATWLGEIFPAAEAAWPKFSIDDHAFADHLARHFRDENWRDIDTTDLYLARACADGNPGALTEFERRCLGDVAKAVVQLGFGAADCDEVVQTVRELLFVHAPGTEAFILRYAGRGTLRAWVRSIAVRTALKSLRGAKRLVPVDEEVFLEFAAADDTELLPYKQRYRAEFRAAFHEAVEGLAVRQRNLLRQYFLDGMTIDELAVLYRVHRATTARWIVDLRTELEAAVRTALASRLHLASTELDSLLGLVASQLSLSLDRLIPVDRDFGEKTG
jgi:RNA polymerase sigma-70 factor (ECF subfamily)